MMLMADGFVSVTTTLLSWPKTWPPRGTAVRGDLPGQFDGGLDRLVNDSPGGLIIIINN